MIHFHFVMFHQLHRLYAILMTIEIILKSDDCQCVICISSSMITTTIFFYPFLCIVKGPWSCSYFLSSFVMLWSEQVVVLLQFYFIPFSILHFSHPERRSWCHGTFSFQFLYMFSMCLVPKLVHMIGFCSRFKKRVGPQMFQCACMHFFYFNISTNSLLFPCLVFSPKS